MTGAPSIPGFEVLERLGEGAQGSVWRARDQAGREVALKVLLDEVAADPEQNGRFLRESRIACSVEHANVVRAYASGSHGGRLWLSCELVRAGSLEDRLQREQRLAPFAVQPLLLDILRGLEAIHAAGLIHRDIKPANILLTSQGVARVSDLGLARSTSSARTQFTATGIIVGSPAYMAPEQIEPVGELDGRCDLYSLGALLFECLTGRVPYAGATVLDILRGHLESPVPNPRDEAPETPEPLAALVVSLLAKSPAERPASAAEAMNRLLGQARAAPAGATFPATLDSSSGPGQAFPATLDAGSGQGGAFPSTLDAGSGQGGAFPATLDSGSGQGGAFPSTLDSGSGQGAFPSTLDSGSGQGGAFPSTLDSGSGQGAFPSTLDSGSGQGGAFPSTLDSGSGQGAFPSTLDSGSGQGAFPSTLDSGSGVPETVDFEPGGAAAMPAGRGFPGTVDSGSDAGSENGLPPTVITGAAPADGATISSARTLDAAPVGPPITLTPAAESAPAGLARAKLVVEQGGRRQVLFAYADTRLICGRLGLDHGPHHVCLRVLPGAAHADESRRISSRHLGFEIAGHAVTVADLGSSVGTELEGARLAANQPRAVIGPTRLKVAGVLELGLLPLAAPAGPDVAIRERRCGRAAGLHVRRLSNAPEHSYLLVAGRVGLGAGPSGLTPGAASEPAAELINIHGELWLRGGGLPAGQALALNDGVTFMTGALRVTVSTLHPADQK